MSETNDNYDVQVDWPTVVPLGDALAVSAGDGFDDRWAEAFEVVLDEHERCASDQGWSGIEFEYTRGEAGAKFVLLVREIEPGARSFELRGTIDELVRCTNTVADVGTHVYELARELRQPEPAAPPASMPPPPFDPLADELRAGTP
jgi:hypothetical protein